MAAVIQLTVNSSEKQTTEAPHIVKLFCYIIDVSMRKIGMESVS